MPDQLAQRHSIAPRFCPDCRSSVAIDGRGSWLCTVCGAGELAGESIEELAEDLSREAIGELERELRLGAHEIVREIVAAELARRALGEMVRAEPAPPPPLDRAARRELVAARAALLTR